MTEEAKKVEYTPELKEEVRSRNLEYMATICKAVRRPAPELMANVVAMNYTNRVADMVKANSEHITHKENGHRFDADVRFPNLAAGTVDSFKTRVSITEYGCSVIIDNRQWVTLEKEEFAKAVDLAKSRSAMRLDDDYEKWLLPVLAGDKAAISSTVGSVILHGSKQKDGDLNAVFENTANFSGVVNTLLPGAGSARDVNYTTRVAVSAETVIHGNLARLLIRMVANINAPYVGTAEGDN